LDVTVMYGEPPPTGGWTTDDLDALPEDGVRRELIDGVLHVPPTPTDPHQSLAGLLFAWLYQRRPKADFGVTQSVEIRVSAKRSFVPDVLVVTAAASRRRPSLYLPHEVVLAVEIVSPGSTAMDRVLKPALYAEAGIPFYWRIETEERLTVHTYGATTSSDLYVPTGEFVDVINTDHPWPMKLPLTDITPDNLY
jgi:Uma2 family endonuclease